MSLNPIVRVPLSTVVSSWNPDSLPVRLETIAASSTGNELELIHALTVMLPVSCSAVGLPRFTKSFVPSSVHGVAVLSGREGRTIGECADDAVAGRIGR